MFICAFNASLSAMVAPGMLIPNICLYCAASSLPLSISALPSGTIPLTTYFLRQLCTEKIAYTADMGSDRVRTFVGSAEHHLVDDNLLSSKDDAVLANNTQ